MSSAVKPTTASESVKVSVAVWPIVSAALSLPIATVGGMTSIRWLPNSTDTVAPAPRATEWTPDSARTSVPVPASEPAGEPPPPGNIDPARIASARRWKLTRWKDAPVLTTLSISSSPSTIQSPVRSRRSANSAVERLRPRYSRDTCCARAAIPERNAAAWLVPCIVFRPPLADAPLNREPGAKVSMRRTSRCEYEAMWSAPVT